MPIACQRVSPDTLDTRSHQQMNYKRCQAVAKQDAENAAPQERTPEYKEALRKKFVERALGYQVSDHQSNNNSRFLLLFWSTRVACSRSRAHACNFIHRSFIGATRFPPSLLSNQISLLTLALGFIVLQGVPYHPRYHTDPASPHHKAPLYLDCCGLVRRVARDLEKEFGFVIGRYNQSYQFDTLPIRISKEEMKPGDLVFLEAPYYDAQKKPQTHSECAPFVVVGMSCVFGLCRRRPTPIFGPTT